MPGSFEIQGQMGPFLSQVVAPKPTDQPNKAFQIFCNEHFEIHWSFGSGFQAAQKKAQARELQKFMISH